MTEQVTAKDINVDFSKETNFGATSAERDAAFRQELERLKNLPPENQVSNEEVNERSEQENEDNNDTGEFSERSSDDSIVDSNDTKSDDLNESSLQNKSIPKKRLDQEIRKRTELEEQLRMERDARIQYETKLNMYNDAMQKLNAQPKAQEQNQFEPIDDVAHNFYVQKIKDLEEKINQSANNLSLTQSQARFEQTVNNQAAEFSAKHADFNDAYKFVVDAEIKNAKLLGYDDQEATNIAMQKLQPIAWKVYEKGGNIAETVYNIAKNYGFSSAPAKKSGVNLKNIESNMRKSQSIIDDIPAKVTDMSKTSSSYVKLEEFKRIDNEDGRGVNPDKFRQLLNRVKNGY